MKQFLLTAAFAAATALQAQGPFPCALSGGGGEPASGGPMTTQNGQYHDNNSFYLTFDVSQTCTLASVRVFANGAGNRSIALVNAAGDVLQAFPVMVPDGESVIELNLPLSPGTGYGLQCLSQNPQLWRDAPPSILNYPYAIGDAVTITGTNVQGQNSLGYYYFFYDWHIEPAGPTVNSGGYPCLETELLDAVPIGEAGGGANGNDCWGWVDPATGKEWAFYCKSSGTAFLDVSDPLNIRYVAELPTATTASLWRDAKVHNDHLFIVSEAAGHGMQVVDLTQLEGLPTDQVTTLTPTAWYQGFGNAHNININEETGFAYPIGSNTFGGSLHIVDISTPSAPTLAGSFEGDYSHDVQSVVYQGPDAAYAGREIVFCFNGYSGFAIVDAEDKQDVQLLSSLTYAELGYTHQGWVSEDHRYCYLDDELDEMNFGNGTRTYIVDIQDLDNPVIVGFYESESPAIDHNLYVIGDKIYQANYLSGLRILDASNAASGSMELVGFFDTNPESDVAEFDGAWSCYPYFPSGNVGISTFSHFFMVRPSDAIAPEGGTSAVHEASQGETFTASPNPARETVQLAGVAGRGDLRVFDAGGRVVTQLNNVLVQGALNLPLHGFTAGLYVAEWTTAAGRATTRFAVE